MSGPCVPTSLLQNFTKKKERKKGNKNPKRKGKTLLPTETIVLHVSPGCESEPGAGSADPRAPGVRDGGSDASCSGSRASELGNGPVGVNFVLGGPGEAGRGFSVLGHPPGTSGPRTSVNTAKRGLLRAAHPTGGVRDVAAPRDPHTWRAQLPWGCLRRRPGPAACPSRKRSAADYRADLPGGADSRRPRRAFGGGWGRPGSLPPRPTAPLRAGRCPAPARARTGHPPSRPATPAVVAGAKQAPPPRKRLPERAPHPECPQRPVRGTARRRGLHGAPGGRSGTGRRLRGGGFPKVPGPGRRVPLAAAAARVEEAERRGGPSPSKAAAASSAARAPFAAPRLTRGRSGPPPPSALDTPPPSCLPPSPSLRRRGRRTPGRRTRLLARTTCPPVG